MGHSMQAIHAFDYSGALQVGHAMRVRLVSGAGNTPLADRISGLGGQVEMESEIYTALSSVIDDPVDCDLLVLDCDSLGGIETGQTAMRTLRAAGSHVPVMMISAAFAMHSFPEARDEAVCLRGPVSDLSLRIGYEHALRDLARWLAA